MPHHPISTDPPIGGTRAQALLGINPTQLHRLRDAGLLGDETTLQATRTTGGHWRYDETRVRALATRPWVDLPSPMPDLAVHLTALAPDPDHREGRTHLGWHASTETAGLSPGQREDAWAGWWVCRPERYRDAALVGDICGFVVEIARIRGWRIAEDGRVRFELSPPTPQMLTRYRGRRFQAAQGGAVQPLGPTPRTSPPVTATTAVTTSITTTSPQPAGAPR